MADSEPYISVVVAARNDNHGGNMLARMQAFLDSWLVQAQHYHLPSEIIVVEWNSPAGARKLKEDLRWPRGTGPCEVRFVEVSPEIHATIPNGAAIPLHQMIAKNAGIRRARGQFALCTNLDIIFSAELMQFLASRRLDKHAFYRMDRYDVASAIPTDAPVEDLLAFCQANILRVCAREGTLETDDDDLRAVEREDIVAANSGLRLGRGWYGTERYPTSPVLRYVEPVADVVFQRPSTDDRYICFDLEIGPSAQDGRIDLDLLDEAGVPQGSVTIDGRCLVQLTLPPALQAGRFSLRARHGGVAMLQDIRILDLRVFSIEWRQGKSFGPPGRRGAAAPSGWKWEVIRRVPGVNRTGDCPAPSPHAASMLNPVYLHTNGCGDFTMLSREAWFALRGYPEFPVWPTHIDAVVCYAAHHAGIREVILTDPMRIFHIEHGTVWTPESEEEREARAAARGVSLVRYQTLLQCFHVMRRFNVPVVFSGEQWGLGRLNLPESSSYAGSEA